MGKKSIKKNDATGEAVSEIEKRGGKRPVATRRDGPEIHVNVEGTQGVSIFGTSDEELAMHFAQQAMCVFPRVIDSEGAFDEDVTLKATNHALSIFHELKPKDPVEAMLISQMIGVHHTSMDLLQKAQSANLDPEQRARYAGLATKMTRTYAVQMEAFKKYRTGGQQTVTVQHVNVGSGGKAIVGNVEQGGGGQ